MLTEETRRAALALQKKLVDEGKLIEGGWAAFTVICFNESTPPEQRREMRKAFFCGAMHLFQSMMSVLGSGVEPTDEDMRAMDKINTELQAFARTERMFEAMFKARQH